MDFLFVALPILAAFVLGVWTGDDIKKALASRKKRLALVTPNPKPQNQFVDHYTVDDLEKHKRYLEREFKSAIHWPILRQAYARDLKEVLQALEWHYDTDGSRERRAEKERVQQDLRNFDEMYAAALKGVKA